MERKLILGQGIAGTILAWRFIERGLAFEILDNDHANSSSMVAAGLWNPIVFRKINKSWLADDLIPELEKFYPEIQNQLGIPFYKPLPIRRIHASKNELDLWFEKKSLEGFSSYLDNPILSDIPERHKKAEFGESVVRHGGYLDLNQFLLGSRSHFKEMGVLKTAEVDDSKIDELLESSHQGKGVEQIIDCRGYKSASSKFWNYLPFGLTKGEVLTIRVPNIKLKEVHNSGFFLVPLGDDLYRLGATFNWEDKDEIPTAEARENLLEKFSNWFSGAFEIVDHKAGVRPTVQDRRPLFGQHPVLEKLFLFNGLGTKGVMLAPYLSNTFLSYLLESNTLPREMDLQRFNRFYGKTETQVNYPTP